MTNLADLIPAGSGQNNTDFVADGNISAGAPVVLTGAGKAAPISITAGSLNSSVAVGSASIYTSGDFYVPILITSGSHSGKVVYLYNDNTPQLRYSVVSYSGSTPSATTPGSPGWNDPGGFVKGFWDETAERIVVFVCQGYGSTASYCWYYHQAFTGTDTLGTPTIGYALDSATSPGGMCDITPIGGGKYVVCSGDISTYNLMEVWSLSGSTLTIGTTIAGPSHEGAMRLSSAKDDEFMYILASNNSSRVIFNGCTVSGTTITKGTDTEITSGGQGYYATMLDSGYRRGFASDWLNKHIAFYSQPGDDTECDCRIIDQSGTSLTLNTINSVDTTEVDMGYGGSGNRWPNLVWGATSGTVVIFYPNRASTQGQLRYAEFSISGNTITTGTSAAVLTTSNIASTAVGGVPNQGTSFLTICYGDYNDSSNVKTQTYAPSSSNLTSTNLLGLAPSAISSTATGTINTWGSRCESTSFLPEGLSVGTSVYVAVANSQPESITYDTNANKTVLAYQDAGSSYHGYAVVGTVTGTSISLGTPVQVNAGAHYYGNSCYDSTNNKVILVYSDGNNSNYLTAIVGTVAGTSISFGSPAVISSQNYADYVGCAYDTNEQKVVVAYKDKGNSNYGTGVVGTVTGTSISFGTATAFNSSDSSPVMVVYDSNAQKVVVDYWDTGNSFYGTAVVGTVSGTSISFGSPVVYNAAQVTNLGACFDSTNNKVVLTYADVGNSNYGTAIVGTVAGTAISFGTEAVFSAGQSGWNRCAYDTNAQKVIISTQNVTDTSGQLYPATVAGTNISFGTLVTFDSDGTSQNNITYDSSSNQVVLGYQAYSDSYKAKAVVGSFGTVPLTIASDYYAQTDGTLSTDTGGQLIGKAIATNQINIKDYTG